MDLASCLTTKFRRLHAVNGCSKCSVLTGVHCSVLSAHSQCCQSQQWGVVVGIKKFPANASYWPHYRLAARLVQHRMSQPASQHWSTAMYHTLHCSLPTDRGMLTRPSTQQPVTTTQWRRQEIKFVYGECGSTNLYWESAVWGLCLQLGQSLTSGKLKAFQRWSIKVSANLSIYGKNFPVYN